MKKMKKMKEMKVITNVMLSVAERMMTIAANSRCAFIYHQPKQPKQLKKYRKF